MTLTDEVIKRIIKKLLNGQDYRIEIITLINAGDKVKLRVEKI